MRFDFLKQMTKLDFLIMGSASIILVVSIFFMSQEDGESPIGKMGGEPLGYMKPFGGDVRLKSQKNLNFSKVFRDHNVYEDDQVFTGTQSTAEVHLDGSTLTVEPNSLIVIQAKENQVQMDVGSFFAFVKKGKQLIVQNEGKEILISSDGASLRIEKDKDKRIKVVVLDGQIGVKNKTTANEEKIEKNETLFLGKEKAEKSVARITTISPSSNQIVWTDQNSLQMKWATSESNEQNNFVVELSRTSDFDVIETVHESRQEQIEIPMLASGFWYWRVKDQNIQDGNHSSSTFRVFPKSSPEITPFKEVVLNPEDFESGSTILFQWSDASYSEDYEFVLSRDKAQTEIVSQNETRSLFTEVRNVKEGQYFWKVKSRHPGRETLESPIGEIQIVKTPSLAETLPEEIIPQENLRAPAQADQEVAPPPPVPQGPPGLLQVSGQNFQFEIPSPETRSSPVARGFVRVDEVRIPIQSENLSELKVRLSTDDSFTDLILEENSGPQDWVWKQPQFGQYYLYFLGKNQNNEMQSEVVSLRTITTAPLIRDIQLQGLPNLAPVLNVSLILNSFADISEIQISKDRDFKNRISRKTSLNFQKFDLDEPGDYYIRARSLNRAGWPISRYSAVEKISVESWLSKQELAVEEQVEEIPEIPRQIVKRPVTKPKPKFDLPLIAPDFVRNERQFGIWGGLGFNYIRYQQTSSEGIETGSFARLVAPSSLFGAKLKIKEKYAGQVEYHHSPGKVAAIINGVNQDYEYTSKSIDFEIQSKVWKKKAYQVDFITGVQIQELPFMSLNASDQIEFLSVNVQKAFIGARLSYFTRSGFEWDTAARLAFPYLSKGTNGDFKLSQSFIYEGLLGVNRRTSSDFKYGVYWYLQSQKWNYETSNSTGKINGTQNFFNSNFQFRLGQEF